MDAFSDINNVVQVLPSDVPAAAATATTTGTAVVTTADGSASGASGDHASVACTAGSPGRAQAPSAPAAEPPLPSPRLQAMSEPFLAWATPSEATSAARHLPRVDPLRAAQAADERMTQAEFGLDPAALIRQQQAIKRSRSAAEMRRLGETDGFASGGEAEPVALPGGLHDALAELDMPEMDPDAKGAAGVSEGGPLGGVAAQPGPLVGPAALAAEAAAASGGGGGGGGGSGGGSGDVGRGESGGRFSTQSSVGRGGGGGHGSEHHSDVMGAAGKALRSAVSTAAFDSVYGGVGSGGLGGLGGPNSPPRRGSVRSGSGDRSRSGPGGPVGGGGGGGGGGRLKPKRRGGRRRRARSPNFDLSRRLAESVTLVRARTEGFSDDASDSLVSADEATGRASAGGATDRSTPAATPDGASLGRDRAGGAGGAAAAGGGDGSATGLATTAGAPVQLGQPPGGGPDAGPVADGEAASAAAGAAGMAGAPRARQASPGETGTEASSRREGKLVLAMVGLPARGKTSIAFKLRRHLNWMGMRTEIYNVGNCRRKLLGAGQEHGFFDPAMLRQRRPVQRRRSRLHPRMPSAPHSPPPGAATRGRSSGLTWPWPQRQRPPRRRLRRTRRPK